MMFEKRKEIQIIKISVFITSIFVIFMSVTYAFMTEVLTGAKQVVINSGVLDLVLEEDNAITISDALPMSDEVGMIQDNAFIFRLVNKTNNQTNYELKITKIVSSNELNPNNVKYYLTKEGIGVPNLLSSLPSDGVVDSGTIVGNDTIDYTLRLWIDSGVTDESLIAGKSLSYKIDVEVSQKIEKVKTTILGKAFEVEESTSTFPNFKRISSETNGRGIYKYQEDGEDIYYWRGKVTDNHVLFAGYCWEMVRTTKTGGVKMIYDGIPVDVGGKKTCPNTGTASQLTNESAFNSNYISPAYIGYMYGNTVYIYKTKSSSDTSLTTAGILYGNDVEWTGTEYRLKAKPSGSLYSSIGAWDTDRTSIGNGNHYTCFNKEEKCATMSYIYYTGDNRYPYYIELSGGATIEKALEQMYSNEQPSKIKTTIENWFETSMINTPENIKKLEDTVYCNDRSVSDVISNGWNKDGNAANFMNYSPFTRVSKGTPDLSCRQTTGNRDRFTYKDTVNGNGMLKYPVGLLSADEIMLAGGQAYSNSDYYLYIGQHYWTLSPFNFYYSNALKFNVDSSGYLSGGNSVATLSGVRPVISLAPSTIFLRGLGIELDPYVVE